MAKTLDELLADITAMTGDKGKLKAGANLPADLVTAANSIADLTAKITALEGEKGQLTADLATAKQTIGTVTKERDDAKASVTKLEGEKQTVEKAVAAKLVELGISDNGKVKTDPKAEAKMTATERVLAAKGVKTLAELEAKAAAQTK